MGIEIIDGLHVNMLAVVIFLVYDIL